MHKYFIVHKPFNVLSQFTSQEGKKTLKDFFDVPVNVYPVGRLDYDSEGLLILTNDKKLNNYLLNPLLAHEREYWVQIENIITQQAIDELQNGIRIKNIPESWIKIILTEGKNRQVRKMTAAVGFPTLRLIRHRIEKLTLTHLQPGEMKILSQSELYNLLQIKKDN